MDHNGKNGDTVPAIIEVREVEKREKESVCSQPV